MARASRLIAVFVHGGAHGSLYDARMNTRTICLMIGLAPSIGCADIIHVPADEPTIWEGIVAASDGDEVVVAPGVYNECIDFLGKDIVVRSSDGAAVTVINCAQNQSVQFEHGETLAATLEGFTVLGNGLGVSMYQSHATIRSCVFNGLPGHAIHCKQGALVLEDCIVTDCMTQPAVSLQASEARISTCTFINNHATPNVDGGAIRIFATNGAPVVISHCDFRNNRARSGGAVWLGANAEAHVLNCLMIGNAAFERGGSIGGQHTNTVTVRNCTIADGTAPETSAGGLWFGDDLNLIVTNSILWGNDHAQLIAGDDSTVQAAYSIIEGGYPGVMITNADPLFVDPDGADDQPGNSDDDYRVSAGSPAIDSGSNWGAPNDLADLDDDGVTDELAVIDLDHAPRFRDAIEIGAGCGVTAPIDQGAYEHDGVVGAPAILGDIDGDGSVGLSDLLVVLTLWNTPGCLADFALDGTVDLNDLLVILAHWG